jgi:hypothetical protein
MAKLDRLTLFAAEDDNIKFFYPFVPFLCIASEQMGSLMPQMDFFPQVASQFDPWDRS